MLGHFNMPEILLIRGLHIGIWGVFIFITIFFLNLFRGESRARTFGQFFLYLFILSLIYLPALTCHCVYHDDVFIWEWDKSTWQNHPQYRTYDLLFRPLSRIIVLSLQHMVNYVNDQNFVRFITVIIISLIALALDIWFRKVCGILKSLSLLMSLALVALPGFQFIVFSLVTADRAEAILLSICSALVLLRPAV